MVAPVPRLPAAQRRQLIEQVAERLFAERGYAHTTVEDIVAGAGVTKPMLYRHFASKKALHLALLERHRDALAAGPIEVYVTAPGPLEERLPAMIDTWFAYVEEHPYAWRLLLADTTGDPEVQALHRELQRRQRAADAAIIRESIPELDEARVEPMAEVVRASLTGLGLWWLEHPEVVRGVLVATMLQMLQGLLLTART